MSFGLLISSICQDERNAIMLTIGMFYPTLVLTGIIWPIEAMPKHMLYLVLPLPQTLSVKAMRAIITKAWGFWHPEVNLGFASTFAWILVFNMVALIIFSRR
jgi:ABC-type multidrug transport system permease subunit